MRNLARVLAAILLLSSGVPSFAKEMEKAEHSSPASTTRSQEHGEAQPKVANQRRKATHHLERMMNQRDWDHRKAGRDWRMRDDRENSGH